MLVTGADGFMGSHLTEALVALEAQLHVFVRATSSGAPRRTLDTSRAEELLGFRASTPLREGIARTVAGYKSAAPTYAAS